MHLLKCFRRSYESYFRKKYQTFKKFRETFSLTTSELFALQPIAHTGTGTQRAGKFKKVQSKRTCEINFTKKNQFLNWEKV